MKNPLLIIILLLVIIVAFQAIAESRGRPVSDSDRQTEQVTDILRTNGYLD